ncbi:squalene/phytoene synthase family protein [Planotetraspora sp. A-T 1434]|uniref:phytoene/squalene synthase family protein n=1 Tax=Planotetraspora sp. A-T 1434 TaxID=2979219 RepID=UPI0021BF6375|nr:squalene/phytoene synthase family protein [Planotetraspora sp. A-T 1434]MCT9934264.1 squalene/phytoene synthase family protein [Planotetraspora sp. A-T 1434]
MTASDAYRHCEQVVRLRARNFSYGIRLLPGPKRRALSAVYAFARRIDDIGDSDGPADERLSSLKKARAALRDLPPDSGDPVLVALHDAACRYPIPLAAFEDLIDGCEADVNGAAYERFDDLLTYCRRVAGSIGRLSLGVFGTRDPSTRDTGARDTNTGNTTTWDNSTPNTRTANTRTANTRTPNTSTPNTGTGRRGDADIRDAVIQDPVVQDTAVRIIRSVGDGSNVIRVNGTRINGASTRRAGTDGPAEGQSEAARLADALGVALQLTNILRDLYEDRLAGRTYLPAEDLERFGCTLDLDSSGRFADPPERLAQLIRFEADRALGWYTTGTRLLPLLDRRSAACAGVMAGIYQRLLARIAADPADVLTARLSVPSWQKAMIAARAVAGAGR